MSLFLTIDVSKVDEKYVMSIYDAHDDIWEQVEVSGPLTFFSQDPRYPPKNLLLSCVEGDRSVRKVAITSFQLYNSIAK